MRKWLKSILVVLTISLLFSTTSFAKSDHAKKSLVALGDSIPYGYNLGTTNDHPSRLAYPYIMGNKADLRVRDLAVPGWTTENLLNAVEFNQKYKQAIRHADYITISIGNNDLLQALQKSGGNSLVLQTELAKTVPLLFANLQNTVYQIRSLTDAPIVIYNIYNPFQSNDPLNGLASYLLNNPDPRQMDINDLYSINALVMNNTLGNVYLADAYTAFGNSGKYVRVGDIHPTAEGQVVLANIGLEALGLE